jgi:hypothetical protein
MEDYHPRGSQGPEGNLKKICGMILSFEGKMELQPEGGQR